MDIIFLFNFSICKDFLVRSLNFSPPPPTSIPFPPVTKKDRERQGLGEGKGGTQSKVIAVLII